MDTFKLHFIYKIYRIKIEMSSHLPQKVKSKVRFPAIHPVCYFCYQVYRVAYWRARFCLPLLATRARGKLCKAKSEVAGQLLEQEHAFRQPHKTRLFAKSKKGTSTQNADQ